MGADNLSFLASQLKRQMNDIVEQAYKDAPPNQLAQYKRFYLECCEDEMRTKLGDCRWDAKDRTSHIRVLGLSSRTYRAVIITTIHEVSHHIDFSIRKESGHDTVFYDIHKKLLFAAMDLGLFTPDDVRNSGTTSRAKNKVIKMLDSYAPHPVGHKQNVSQIYVYNAFAIKETLKGRGYRWNSLDEAWVKELSSDAVEDEKHFLLRFNKITEKDIKVIEGALVTVRLRKNARVYNFPIEKKDIIKQYGYRWRPAQGRNAGYWEKKIDGDTLPPEEELALRAFQGVVVRVV